MSNVHKGADSFIPLGMLEEARDFEEAHAISLRIITRALVQVEALSAWVERRKGCDLDRTEMLEQLDMVADQIRDGLDLVGHLEPVQFPGAQDEHDHPAAHGKRGVFCLFSSAATTHRKE